MTVKSDKAADKAKGPERKEYTLKANHTHRGKELKPGDKIELTSSQARFLREKLVAATTSAAADQAAAVKEG